VLDIGTGSKLYKRSDIDSYVVDTKRGRKASKPTEAIESAA